NTSRGPFTPIGRASAPARQGAERPRTDPFRGHRVANPARSTASPGDTIAGDVDMKLMPTHSGPRAWLALVVSIGLVGAAEGCGSSPTGSDSTNQGNGSSSGGNGSSGASSSGASSSGSSGSESSSSGRPRPPGPRRLPGHGGARLGDDGGGLRAAMREKGKKGKERDARSRRIPRYRGWPTRSIRAVVSTMPSKRRHRTSIAKGPSPSRK